MILDRYGNEATRPEPQPEPKHRFGEFRIPDGCHIKGFGTIGGDERNSDVWYTNARRWFKPQANRNGGAK